MKQEILNRIQQLGGIIDQVKGGSLAENLQAIEFRHPLYPRKPWGEELYGIDDYYSKNKETYQSNKPGFYKNLIDHFFSDQELWYGQMFFRKELFTPFKEGTADFEEWNPDFSDEGDVDLSEVYKVTENKTPDFIKIADNSGYPDGFYVCLSDKNPDNPTVFGTDHELFFSEVTNEGTLENFFEQFYTKEEFLQVVENYIENKETDI